MFSTYVPLVLYCLSTSCLVINIPQPQQTPSDIHIDFLHFGATSISRILDYRFLAIPNYSFWIFCGKLTHWAKNGLSTCTQIYILTNVSLCRNTPNPLNSTISASRVTSAKGRWQRTEVGIQLVIVWIVNGARSLPERLDFWRHVCMGGGGIPTMWDTFPG